ncbi:MAG: transcription initiation factor IIB [Thaumarchaeota archaeon]|nr:transcription initiation factor IIB [Nitrososphaerota archaeon]MBI3641561.1 transcription initiation factor IIB [Nitrososphaerota archaeon]
MITDNVLGEVICGSCGLVLLEKEQDSGTESKSYDIEEFLTKSRTGAGLSLAMHDKGLTTVIGPYDKDAIGNSLSADMKNTFHRLRIWDNRSKARLTNKSLRSALILLDSMKTKLGIPDMVIEQAAYIYRKAVSSRIIMGRSSISMIGASLYAACRESDTPRTLNDIAGIGNMTKKNLSRSYRKLLNTLDLKLRSFDSSEFITRLSTEVGTSEKTRRDALNILSNAVEKEISAGKNPMGLAAAALYISCMMNGERKNQQTIARASGITAVTIRNRSASLRKELGIKYD